MGVLVNRRIALWALLLLIAGSIAGSLKVSHQQHETTDRLQETTARLQQTIECNTARYTALVANLKVGRQVSSISDAAKTRVIQGFGDLTLHPATTPEDQARDAARGRELFEQYNQAQADVQRYRDQNPYPDLDSPCKR